MEEHRLKVFGDMMLRKIFGSKKEEITEVEENCTVRCFTIFTLHRAIK